MNVVQRTFKDISTHIVTHDVFDNIILEINLNKSQYDIECHCGKKWAITLSEATECNLEGYELIEFIDRFNTPEFHSKLAKIREKSIVETEKREELIIKTQSPTISSLEI